jgi:hypothetical protein
VGELQTYAALAEIFSALTIILGGVFAAFQFTEYRRRRRGEVAAELCRRFAEPEFARAITLIRRLPDGIGVDELQALDPPYDEAVQIFGMAVETMGLLVHEKIASFQMIRKLAGGLLVSMWPKVGTSIREIRTLQGNPRYGEWVQWLVERIQEREQDMLPAYVAHKFWRSSSD